MTQNTKKINKDHLLSQPFLIQNQIIRTKYHYLAFEILLYFSSCDLNDDNQNGGFSLFLRATIDGALWDASPTSVVASLNTNGVQYLISIDGNLATDNEYFILESPPLRAFTTDTTIVSIGMAGIKQFHRNSQTWTSVNGSLTVHQACASIQR